MKQGLIIMMLSIIFCPFTYAQNLDSLKQELIALNGDYSEIDLLPFYFGSYNDFNQMDEVSQKLSEHFSTVAPTLYIKNEIARGYILCSSGNLKRAASVLTDLAKLKTVRETDSYTSTMCNLMGNIYMGAGQFEKARKYYRYFYDKMLLSGDTAGQKGAVINIGHSYYAELEFDSARYYFEEAILYEADGEMAYHANLLNNFALVYLEFGEYDKALVNYEMLINESENNPKHQIIYLLNYANTLVHFDRRDEALESLYQAEEIALHSHDNGVYPSVLSTQATHLAEMGQFQEAYTKQKMADSLKIIDLEDKPDIAVNQLHYDYEKQLIEQENLNTTLRLETAQKRTKNLGIFLGILSLSAIIIIVLFIRSRRLLHSIKDKNDELSRMNDTIDTFNLHVSHDLKTILNNSMALSGMIEKYNKRNDNNKVAEIAQRLTNLTSNGKKTIESFLEIGKMSTLGKSAENRTLQPKEEVNTILENNGLTEQITVKIKDELVTDFPLEEVAFESILLNFFTNTIKYNDNAPEATIRFEKGKRMTKIIYADNGIGIDLEKDGERLFAPFKRIKNATSSEGSGVGLYMTKKIILQHGGEIIPISTPGNGLTFEINLPVKTRKAF